ncbi:MAG: hypothetical protein IJI15_05160, partial [Atopobiaceae bacterium]|nr:hypothetical protein [Atopobiaceae bacterium]
MGSLTIGRDEMRRMLAAAAVTLCLLLGLPGSALADVEYEAEPETVGIEIEAERETSRYEFQVIDGYTFCFDNESGAYLSDGIYEVDGESYYFRGQGNQWGPSGSMGYGWFRSSDGTTYFFDRTDGHML